MTEELFKKLQARRIGDDDEPVNVSSAWRIPNGFAFGNDSEEEPEILEEALPFDELPAAVKAAVAVYLPGVTGFAVIKALVEGVELYSIQAKRGRAKVLLTVSLEGGLIEFQHDLPKAKVPSAVKAALKRHCMDATITDSSEVRLQFYEFRYELLGEPRIVQINCAGQVLQDIAEPDVIADSGAND